MKRLVLICFLLLPVCVLTACGAKQGSKNSIGNQLTSQSAVLPQNNSEKIVLEKVAAAKVGTSIKTGKYSILIRDEYFAASGRVCRAVEITPSAKPSTPTFKTVCLFDGKWGYTQEVFPKKLSQ